MSATNQTATYHTVNDSWGDTSGGHTIENYREQAVIFEIPPENIVEHCGSIYERKEDYSLELIAEPDPQPKKQRIIIMQGHPPIRTTKDTEEFWLGYPCLDFGGMYLRGIKLNDGRFLLWYRYNTPNTDGTSYSRYIATLQPVTTTVADLATARVAYKDLDKLLGASNEYTSYLGNKDVSEVQEWLADLGYSMIADVD
jgi:hypothetical protein